jgi:hypothetical protein
MCGQSIPIERHRLLVPPTGAQKSRQAKLLRPKGRQCGTKLVSQLFFVISTRGIALLPLDLLQLAFCLCKALCKLVTPRSALLSIGTLCLQFIAQLLHRSLQVYLN